MQTVPPRQPVIPGMEAAVGRQAANTWDAIKKGVAEGYQFGMSRPYKDRSYSAVTVRAPAENYDYLPQIGRVAYTGGRVAADIQGHGTRSILWNAQPEDFGAGLLNKYFAEMPKGARLPAVLASTAMLGIGSGIYNPLNIVEGGRTAGYQAINPDAENPTQTSTPLYDLAVERGFFGRKGRLLPWQEFTKERPDVSFEDYENYKEYLFKRDDNLLRDLTLGTVQATNGINGPELSIMGYGVTPGGVAASLGTAYGLRELAKLIPRNQVTPDDVNFDYTNMLNRRSANTERYTDFVGDYPVIHGMEEVMQPSAPPANYQAPRVASGLTMPTRDNPPLPRDMSNPAEPGTPEYLAREKNKARLQAHYEKTYKPQYSNVQQTKPRRVYNPT